MRPAHTPTKAASRRWTRAARLKRKRAEHIELGRRQLHGPAVDGNPTTIVVDDKIAEPEQDRAGPPAQGDAHARHQLGR